jgi:hypothetical protein
VPGTVVPVVSVIIRWRIWRAASAFASASVSIIVHDTR